MQPRNRRTATETRTNETRLLKVGSLSVPSQHVKLGGNGDAHDVDRLPSSQRIMEFILSCRVSRLAKIAFIFASTAQMPEMLALTDCDNLAHFDCSASRR